MANVLNIGRLSSVECRHSYTRALAGFLGLSGKSEKPDFIKDREAGWKNAKHRQQWRNTWETYTRSIWVKPVADVDVEDVLAILRPIWSSKQEKARRVRGRIEAVLNAVKVRKLRSGENPALWRGNLQLLLARQRKGPKQHHPAMSFNDVPAFIVELRSRPALAARALEFTILSVART